LELRKVKSDRIDESAGIDGAAENYYEMMTRGVEKLVNTMLQTLAERLFCCGVNLLWMSASQQCWQLD
jgi:hypothetical protein